MENEITEHLNLLVQQRIRFAWEHGHRILNEPAARAELLSAGLVYSYAPGSSATVPTYIDAERTTPNCNPVHLDSMGYPPPMFPPLGGCDIKVVDSWGNTLSFLSTVKE